ncbi:Alpha/Beta hydrolase protein [Xylariaceae sp. FL0804]|nr:Alpha/Beta hydrolase protein [Xylariaceae sp. FL0804]
MSGIKKAYAETALGQVHYRFTPAPGTRRFPILFLHMSASSSACFEALMAAYAARGYQCFAPDMPGFGQSFDPATDPPGIPWYAGLYLEVFARLPAFARGCHVFGHHSGGVIGLELAAGANAASHSHSHHPAFVVRSLCLEGPAVLDAEQRAAMGAQMKAFNRPVRDGSHWRATWEYLQRHGGIPGAEVDLLQQETLDHARAWRGRMQIYACVFGADHDGPALLARVACPVLALCARDDVLWAHFGAVSAARPDARTGEVRGANFGPSRDPDGIAGFLTPFLEEAEAEAEASG